MRVLLLGVGMQGKAALHDLDHSDRVAEIIAADRDFETLKAYVQDRQYAPKVRCEYVDAEDPESISRLMQPAPGVVIDQFILGATAPAFAGRSGFVLP